MKRPICGIVDAMHSMKLGNRGRWPPLQIRRAATSIGMAATGLTASVMD